jgi:hypothetical protein
MVWNKLPNPQDKFNFFNRRDGLLLVTFAMGPGQYQYIQQRSIHHIPSALFSCHGIHQPFNKSVLRLFGVPKLLPQK